MELLQAVFTTLWTIWNHRNMVLHKGKAQGSLSTITRPEAKTEIKAKHNVNQNWQVLINVVASKNRRTKRCGYAIEARKLDGTLLFRGGASSGRPTQHLAVQEALVEALIKSTAMGLYRVVVVSTDQRMVEICNKHRKAAWQGQALLMDLQNLHRHSIFVCT
ncbi:hypothetical protein SO802_031782 [Lithocarpus litseifolius]|uniref:RNase H type-1 domain-containing protein n=1 Tax=Lithocarpus litseifolius TaxID=425828 RepID=A0AAW2BN95_9ROSI